MKSNSPPLGTSSIAQQNITSIDVAEQLQKITSWCEDSENRLRRSNLLFYGIKDEQKEDWAASEKEIIEFCADKLNIPVTGAQFERVHGIGRFNAIKNRPIIAKMTFPCDKQSILSSARKLKGMTFVISEDFSLPTMQGRKKLLEFSKCLTKSWKLSVDKLRVDNDTKATDTVVALAVHSVPPSVTSSPS